MVDVGFLATEFEVLRVALAGLASRRIRVQGWTRVDEFLLSAHEVRAAVVVDLDVAGGRLGAIVSAARRLSAGKIIALASDEQLVEASSAYEHGLDAVVSKRVSPAVAAAQIYNLALKEQLTPRHASVEIGPFRFDELSRQITRGGDVALRLTEKEAQILALFLRRGPEPLSRDQISMDVFAIPYQANDRRIDVHISNLRRKVRSVGVPFGVFTTGGGYYGVALAGGDDDPGSMVDDRAVMRSSGSIGADQVGRPSPSIRVT